MVDQSFVIHFKNRVITNISTFYFVIASSIKIYLILVRNNLIYYFLGNNLKIDY